MPSSKSTVSIIQLKVCEKPILAFTRIDITTKIIIFIFIFIYFLPAYRCFKPESAEVVYLPNARGLPPGLRQINSFLEIAWRIGYNCTKFLQ